MCSRVTSNDKQKQSEPGRIGHELLTAAQLLLVWRAHSACRRPPSGAPLTDRVFSRADRSVEPRPSRPPGQIRNSAARLSCGDMPPGKRCRLGPLNPYSKVIKFSNQLGHFISALQQSLKTTKTNHIRHSHKLREIQHIMSKCTTRRDFPSRRNTVRRKENATSRRAKDRKACDRRG